MANIIERIYFIQQTSRALAALLAGLVVIVVLTLISLKLLGIVLAASGLAAIIWFPGITTHQSSAFTGMMIKFGALLMVIGLLLVLFG
jgi:predicted phage tail protein